MTVFLRTFALICFLFALPLQAQANKLLMPGDVIKGHVKEEANCEVCHKKFDKKAQSKLCMDCHKDVGKDVAEKKGYHGRIDLEKECKECHAEHKGRDFKAAEFDQKKFDHKLTDFVLKGGHLGEKAKCETCHKPEKKFREAPSYCNDCHKKDDKHKGGLGTDCAKCHVDKDWKTTQFDHDKTKFKLLGKHIDVKCIKCHIDNKFKDTPLACVSCHKKDDDKAHKGKLGDKCESCHGEKDWKTTKFDHEKTKFPLLGKHKDVKCDKCHIDKKYKDTPKLCNSCHKKDDDKAHKGKFGPKCETCHVEDDWKKIKFDHDKETKYPLLGKHKKIKCTDCHKGDLYKDKIKVTTCVSCHQKADDKAHKGKFGPKCESCHVEEDWKKIKFDHDKDTKYPLLGKHKKTKCTDCHKGDLYKDKLKQDCLSCHEKDDKHKGQEGKKCETCHVETSWKDVDKFNHNRMSTFPLLGKHSLVACKKCHLAPTFKDAKPDCWSCHEKDDEKVHKRRLGTECQVCHSTRAWGAWDFDHNKTKFKLDGAHKKTA
ncbi:MAG: cytochrome c3 family protein, partial [Sideroxyarcus sp.]|nr:cytochrome c3 family protein [Sideroxyarcus sp.]